MTTPLALKALSAGIDKIPDHVWETVPIYRPPKEVRDQRKREQREQEKQNQQGGTNENQSSPTKDRRSSDGDRRHRSDDRGSFDQRRQDHPPNDHYSRGDDRYDDDDDYYDHERERPRGYQPYRQQDSQSGYTPNRYVPPGAPPQASEYPIVEPPPMGDNYSNYTPARDNYDNRRYNPSDYAPSGDHGGGYGNQQQYLQAPARYRPNDQDSYKRSHSAGAPRYDDNYDDNDSYDSRGRDDSRSNKGHKGKARSRSRGAQHVLHKNFDTTDKGMAYGAVGALAGGALGHHFGKGPIATVAGAVIGGLGANALEARHERRKSGRLEVPHKHSRSRSTGDPIDPTTRRDLEYYGSRRDRGYDDYSDDEDEQPRRRGSQHGRRKSRGADDDDRY